MSHSPTMCGYAAVRGRNMSAWDAHGWVVSKFLLGASATIMESMLMGEEKRGRERIVYTIRNKSMNDSEYHFPQKVAFSY